MKAERGIPKKEKQEDNTGEFISRLWNCFRIVIIVFFGGGGGGGDACVARVLAIVSLSTS